MIEEKDIGILLSKFYWPSYQFRSPIPVGQVMIVKIEADDFYTVTVDSKKKKEKWDRRTGFCRDNGLTYRVLKKA